MASKAWRSRIKNEMATHKLEKMLRVVITIDCWNCNRAREQDSKLAEKLENFKSPSSNGYDEVGDYRSSCLKAKSWKESMHILFSDDTAQ